MSIPDVEVKILVRPPSGDLTTEDINAVLSDVTLPQEEKKEQPYNPKNNPFDQGYGYIFWFTIITTAVLTNYGDKCNSVLTDFLWCSFIINGIYCLRIIGGGRPFKWCRIIARLLAVLWDVTAMLLLMEYHQTCSETVQTFYVVTMVLHVFFIFGPLIDILGFLMIVVPVLTVVVIPLGLVYLCIYPCANGCFCLKEWYHTVVIRHIRRIPSVLFPGGKEVTCAVCQEDLQTGVKIVTLPECQHSFHDTCIRPWIEKNNNCPVCRRQVVSV